MTLDFTGQTVLITGASSGLGAEFAKALAARGAELVLVARRTPLLEELAASLNRDHGATVTVLPADLARPGIGVELRQTLTARGITVATLINNAGVGAHGDFAHEDPARIAAQIPLNVAALVDLTRAFLPDLLSRGTGALVTVASTAAFQATPKMAVYGASKAFVLSFTEAIAYETRDSALRVLAVCPGSTRTEFFDVVGTRAGVVGRLQTPEQVVATALRALDKPRTAAWVVSGRSNKVSIFFARLAPRWVAVAAAGRLLAGDSTPERRPQPQVSPARAPR